MKKILILLVILTALFCVVGCKTTTVAELPEFAPVVPVRPELRSMSDVSADAAENIRDLVIYARELEAYGEGWREFYDNLRNEIAVKGE